MIDVPVIYGSGERWKLAQKDGFYRDKNGKVQTPLVMLKRESIEKRRDLGNKLDANAPQLYITHQEKYTKRNSYDRFSLLNNRIPQKEFTATVVPDYVNLTYNGIIWTDYISQLNKIIEAVNYASDSYWGDSEKFKFMAMIDSFNNINELSNDDGRIVRANFSLKLQGYIVPDSVQKKLNEQNTRYFSKAQIVLNQATTVIEDSDISAPSTRSKIFRTSPGTVSGTGGGSSTNITQVDDDGDWLIETNKVKSTRKVEISHQLSFKGDGSNTEDLFLIDVNYETFVKVDSSGILSLKEFNGFPTAKEGGLLYLNNEFYLGLG